MGVFIFLFDAILATLSIYVIQTVSVELNANSFAELAAAQFGIVRSRRIVNSLLILALFGPIISYFIILGDIAMTTFPNYNWIIVKSAAIIVSAGITVYFCLKRNLAQISITSLFVFGSLVLFLSVLFGKYYSEELSTENFYSPRYSIELFASIPGAYMALNCHNNFFQVRESMRNKDQNEYTIVKVFGAAFTFCALAYILVALTGLSLYGTEVKHDILLNIAKDGFGGHLIRVAYTIIPLMSIPVLFLVAKQSLIDMVFEQEPGGPDIP